MVFEKNVEAVVRGIRANPQREGAFMNEVLSEIKKELKSTNLDIKANAVEKLVYLEMVGYDMAWASFDVMTLLSSTKFPHKRVGYLAAQQSYHPGTDVLLLVCNSVKKDLTSPRYVEATLAMNGMANFLTPVLGANLSGDVAAMISSSKPNIRKRAILLMYKMFLVHPESLRPTFSRLKQRLDDADPSVQSACVTVIYELACKNPKVYTKLAPEIFKIMQESQHNWMLIKCIKIFGALCPHEPRLSKKLAEPLVAIITNSSRSIALIYECIATVTKGGMYTNSRLLAVCVDKLNTFLEDDDLNLNYLGLTQMAKIIKLVPKVVVDRRHLVRACLRVKALNLLVDITAKKNCVDTVSTLMDQLESSNDLQFRIEVVKIILSLLCNNNYKNVVNFDWFVSILIKLAQSEGHGQGATIAKHFLDVAVRVKAIREEVTREALHLITDAVSYQGSNAKDSVTHVLGACAWIIGEFCRTFSDQVMVFSALMHSRIKALPGQVASVFLTSALKVYCACARSIVHLHDAGDQSIALKKEQNVLATITSMFNERLETFLTSPDPELQERACAITQLLAVVKEVKSQGEMFFEGHVATVFADPLKPVAPKAQKKVPLPEGLDLDTPINEDALRVDDGGDILEATSAKESKKARRRAKEARKAAKLAREEAVANNPYYVPASSADKDKKRLKKKRSAGLDGAHGVEQLDLGDLKITVEGGSTKKDKKSKKKAKVIEVKSYEIEATEEMPEGAMESEGEEDLAKQDPHALLAVDLEEPIEAPKPSVYRQTDSANMLKDKPKMTKAKKGKKHAEGQAKAKGKKTAKIAPVLLLAQNEKMRVDYAVTCENTATVATTADATIHLAIKCKDAATHLQSLKIVFGESQALVVEDKEHNVGDVAGKKTSVYKVKGTITEFEKRQKLTGSIHYDGGETLEFSLMLLGTMLNVATPLSQDKFTALLGSGDLGATTSIDFPAAGDFSAMVERICKVARVSVVEEVEQTVSAYASTIFGKHVALLIKHQNGIVHIDSKSTGDVLSKTVLAEIKKHSATKVKTM